MKSVKELPVAETIPLWERWPRERLIQRRTEIGETAFNRGYRNIAYADKDLLFRALDDCVVIGQRPAGYMKKHFPRFAGVDLSGDRRPGNAIVSIGVIPHNRKRVILDVRRGDWTSTETAEQIYNLHKIHNYRVVKVENNAYQQSLIDWMRTGKYQGVPISAHTTGMQKSHPEYGLPGLAVELERGAWIIPMEKEHEADCSCGLCAFLAEARSYPAGTDADTVMAWWFAKEAAGAYGEVDAAHIRRGARTDAGWINAENF